MKKRNKPKPRIDCVCSHPFLSKAQHGSQEVLRGMNLPPEPRLALPRAHVCGENKILFRIDIAFVYVSCDPVTKTIFGLLFSLIEIKLSARPVAECNVDVFVDLVEGDLVEGRVQYVGELLRKLFIQLLISGAASIVVCNGTVEVRKKFLLSGAMQRGFSITISPSRRPS